MEKAKGCVMGKKVLRYVFIALGLALCGAGWYLLDHFNNMPEVTVVEDCGLHEEYNAGRGDARYVMLKGKISPHGVAEDKDFGVKARFPILVRKVEMYQFFKTTENGEEVVKRGWKGKAIKSFKDKKGREFKNPPFPSGLADRSFYGDLSINGGTLPVSSAYMKKIFEKEKAENKLYYLKQLPEKNKPEGYVYKTSHYLKPSGTKNNVGSIRIYYKAYNYTKNTADYTIVGKQLNGRVEYTGEECRLLEGALDKEAVRNTYRDDAPHAALGACLFGAFFILFGLFKAQS